MWWPACGSRVAVASGFGNNPDGTGFLDPLLGREGETVQTRQLLNPVEFAGIKIEVVAVQIGLLSKPL